MNVELTEEEMRRALFGSAKPVEQISTLLVKEPLPEVAFTKSVEAQVTKRKKVVNAFTARLRVTLRVGNEFEGKMQELIHEADTLSTLLAEQEAMKNAKKKYKYVEVVSIKSM